MGGVVVFRVTLASFVLLPYWFLLWDAGNENYHYGQPQRAQYPLITESTLTYTKIPHML